MLYGQRGLEYLKESDIKTKKQVLMQHICTALSLSLSLSHAHIRSE